MKAIGIEIGTSKSSIAYEEAYDIKIIPNDLGDKFIPSTVALSSGKVVAGINANMYKISNYDKTITESKRLLGKFFSRKDIKLQNFKKHLSYDLIEQENKPILIKLKEDIFSPEEIYAYLIKKVIDNGKRNNIFTRKAILSVPACFGLGKRLLIKKAAKMAGLDESRIQIVNDSIASALAFEIYINKINQNLNYEYNFEIFLAKNKIKNIEGDADSPASLVNVENKLSIIFDLGGGCFDLTLLSIQQKDDKLEFDTLANLGDPNFGCLDFDNKMVDYCIKEFCQKLNINEDLIYQNKKSIQRLKCRCEYAKKILSRRENVVINVDEFYENEDLCSYMTIDTFNSICQDLYDKILNKIEKLLNISNKSVDDINGIYILGGAIKIPKIIELMIEKFSRKKVIYNLDKDKIVLNGAVLYGCEMNKKKKSIIISDRLPLSIGLEVTNNDFNSYIKHGNIMSKILKQNTKLPASTKKKFKVQMGDNKKLELNFYEGENKYVNYNEKLYDLKLELTGADSGSIVEFDATFQVDTNYILKIIIEAQSLGITKEIEIGKLNKNDKLELHKKFQSNKLGFDFAKAKNELFEYVQQIENYQGEDKNNNLINCCKCCEDILEALEKNYYREDVIENIFVTTRDLFIFYRQRLKIKDKKINDNDEIILKIKERMKNVIGTVGYVENLLEEFKDIYIFDKNIFFEIMINYMELMNNEGVNLLMKKNRTRKNYSKIYFKSCTFVIRKIVSEMDINEANEELKQKYEVQKKINEYEIEFINSRETNDKSIHYQSLKNILDSINNRKYKWFKDAMKTIGEIQKQYETNFDEE